MEIVKFKKSNCFFLCKVTFKTLTFIITYPRRLSLMVHNSYITIVLHCALKLNSSYNVKLCISIILEMFKNVSNV